VEAGAGAGPAETVTLVPAATAEPCSDQSIFRGLLSKPDGICPNRVVFLRKAVES